ncbi:MAG: YibE/F family protein [Kiritimatiellae bacterium]|nr:YibE/F family protein [Kiritimatiellia bacterium]
MTGGASGIKAALPFLATLLATALALFAPIGERREATRYPSAIARVVAVDDSRLATHGLMKYGEQVLEVEIVSGERKGSHFKAANTVRAQMELDKFFSIGDTITVALPDGAEEGSMLTARDHWRLGWIAAGFGMFAIMLVAFGGLVGANALASFAFSCAVIWRFVVPLSLAGMNASLVAFAATSILAAAIMFLVGGPTRKALAAFGGSMLGVAAGLALAHFFGGALKINGATLPFVQTLVYSGFADLDLADVFIAATVLAGSGAMMDLAMDIAAGVREVSIHNTALGFRALFASGIRIGRATVGTMTTTLLLAYSGGYLTLLMVFYAQGTPPLDFASSPIVAAEIAKTLVGSLSIVLVAPFTALVAAVLFRRKNAAAGGGMRFPTAVFFAIAACVCAKADCLDELLPRPRLVVRGANAKANMPEHDPVSSYRLVVSGGKPEFEGDEEGRRYAKATFAQLKKLAGKDQIPDCTIVDWPEFRYRGIMLDCGRNYQSVASIKDVISMLAAYKYNVFHWHLTDNYGWRLESKKHPELQKPEAFTRNAGKFYTQAEFKEVLAFARSRGVTVIPELDMPGHTLAFRKATGISDLADERAKKLLGELIDELCTLASASEMPIIHLGTDEARERGENVPQSHLDHWAAKVTGNGRRLMGWSPGLKLPGQTIKHLWMGANDPRGDRTPYIDSQNSFYINHVDPEELLSVAAYQQPCRWGGKDEKLGAIIGVWHDDAIADTEDVARMNAVYPAIALLSDSFWRGREKDEPSLYARLPSPEDPRFALAADLERRLIAQRDKVLKGMRHPFPYVAQTHMRWRMTEGGGNAVAKDISQATVYPRHFWFGDSAYVKGKDGEVTLETWIESPRDISCGAWIGMTGFSRSDGRKRDAPTPKIGEWNKHGATIELNGKAIRPPAWAHPGQTGNPKETPLVDEDYWYREPTRIRLAKGVNHVKMTLPKHGGWKWIGTFVPVLGTSDHPCEVPDLRFFSSSP